MSAEEAQATGLSKSAKRRAAKKARDAAGEDTAVDVPEVPQPKAATKAAPKAAGKAEPKASPKAEPKASPKAEPKAQTKAAAPAEAKPKNKAQGQPKADPKPAAKSPPEKPKAKPAEPEPKKEPKANTKAKAQTKPAAKAQQPKAAKQEEEEPKKKENNDLQAFIEYDDGTGGDWEMASGLTKKQQKQKDRKEQREREEKELAKQEKAAGIPGSLPVPANQKLIPGMAPVGPAGYPVEPKAAAKAKAPSSVAAAIAESQPETKSKAAAEPMTVVNIPIPAEKIGRIIGPKGATLKLIKDKTGVADFDTNEGVCTISGSAQACQLAEMAVRELIDKNYTSLAYDNFKDDFLNVHPSAFPELIGKEGKVIRAIKETLSVEITMPERDKLANAPKGKKFKVTMAGTTENVNKAKEVINDILMYGHSEITHPGKTHEEVEIDDWALRYVIGTKGSELRHIQNNYDVKVNIPREFSLNKKPVIVGEPGAVERAKKHIENVIWKAQNQTKGRGSADGALDVWGPEEEEEDWMKAYLYKR